MTLAAPASAHAELVDARPRPGTGLPQAPGAVVVKFTEPLSTELSRLEVRDDAGRDVGEGRTRPVVGDRRAMRRALGLLPPGRYTVRWTTVSTLDGHTLRGSYTFGIGTSATDTQSVRDSPVDSEGLLGLAGRLVALVGLSLWAGWALTGHLATRAGLTPGSLRVLRHAGPRLALIGTALAVVSSALVASGSWRDVPAVLATSQSGRRRAVVLLAAAVASAPRWRRRGLDPALAGVALVAEASSGHAAAGPLVPLAVATFAVHLAAAGVWLFALAASVLSRDRLLDTLRLLTPYALVAAAVVGLTGTANAAFELGGPGDLFGTGYGLTVFAKALAFVAMAGIGLFHNHERRRPEPDPVGIGQVVGIELGVGVAALALATLLVGFPNPPREAEASARLRVLDPELARLDGRPALAVAEPSGPFVVGVTVSPPRPGPVELRVQVVGTEPGDGVRRVRVRGSRSSRETFEASLAPCGTGCFEGEAELPAEGRWELAVSMASNRGAIAATVTVPLPAPDGEALLGRALTTMERLRSARMTEELRSRVGDEPLVGRYTYRAPDAYAFEVDGKAQVTIGSRSFRREGPVEPWVASSVPGPPFSWPENHLRAFWGGRAAARVLGTEEVDGVPATVVAFVRPELPAWFRVWVDGDGRVVRQRMLAEGHLMEHRYEAFDVPVRVEAPS